MYINIYNWRAGAPGAGAPMRKRAEWHRLGLGPKGPRIVRNTTCIAFKSVYRLNPNFLLDASAGFDPHTCALIEPPIVLRVCILNISKPMRGLKWDEPFDHESCSKLL
jgi:hypothetical protein